MRQITYDDLFFDLDPLIRQAERCAADPSFDASDRQQAQEWLEQLRSWQAAQQAGRHEIGFVHIDGKGVHKLTCVCGLEVAIVLDVDLGYQLEEAEGHRALPPRAAR